MIDSDGFRANVGIILSNAEGKVFWARRIGQPVWQFPQGGIWPQETPEEAMYRELSEETGLNPCHVTVVGRTRGWLRYRLPDRLVRHDSKPVCIGQKQVWYMLRLQGCDKDVKLDCSTQPEFDYWRWVAYWYPLQEVVSFKRKVYARALHELAPLLGVSSTPSAVPTSCTPQR